MKNLAMIRSDLAALTVKRAAIPDQSDNRDGIVKIKTCTAPIEFICIEIPSILSRRVCATFLLARFERFIAAPIVQQQR